MHLRSARAADREEVPDHFEGVALPGATVAAAWLAAIAGVAGGVTVMVVMDGTLLEAVGAVVAAVGGFLGLAVARCRRFEIEVGRRWIRVGAGPLRQRLPRELVETVVIRSATGWRRLFAPDEAELSLRVGRVVAVPTLNPGELRAALGL